MMFQLPLATAAVALLVLPAAAQDAPSNGGVPIYDITPRALPTLTPTVPVLPVPTPSATPTPRAVPRATPTARATPVSRATPAPRPSPTPRAAEVAPSPVPTSTEAPVPAPLQDAGPSPAPSPEPLATPEAAPSAAPAFEAVAPVANDAGTPWWIWFLAGLVVAGLVAWLIGRMRRGRTEAPVSVEPVAAPAPQPVVPPAPAPAPVAPLPPVPSPVIAPPAAPVPPSLPPRFLDFQLAPLRVALQDERVLLDFDLGVGNGTDVAADEVRIATLLLTANAQQDEQIAAFLDREPGGGLEPFELASGDQRMVEATMTLPRHMLNVVTARERPFFVPIMVIDARYRWADGRQSRTSAAFMVGQGLPNGRLSPVFLDRGDRTVERLEARLHGEIRRT